MSDQYAVRSRHFLVALMAVGVLLSACRPAPSSPPAPTRQRSRPGAAPGSGQQPASPERPDVDDDSNAVMALSAAAGGMIVLRQQEDHTQMCPGGSCESTPFPFLKLRTM